MHLESWDLTLCTIVWETFFSWYWVVMQCNQAYITSPCWLSLFKWLDWGICSWLTVPIQNKRGLSVWAQYVKWERSQWATGVWNMKRKVIPKVESAPWKDGIHHGVGAVGIDHIDITGLANNFSRKCGMNFVSWFCHLEWVFCRCRSNTPFLPSAGCLPRSTETSIWSI